MKTKEIHSTGNINYIIACRAALKKKKKKENLDRNRHFPMKIFDLFQSHFYHQ